MRFIWTVVASVMVAVAAEARPQDPTQNAIVPAAVPSAYPTQDPSLVPVEQGKDPGLPVRGHNVGLGIAQGVLRSIAAQNPKPGVVLANDIVASVERNLDAFFARLGRR